MIGVLMILWIGHDSIHCPTKKSDLEKCECGGDCVEWCGWIGASVVHLYALLVLVWRSVNSCC